MWRPLYLLIRFFFADNFVYDPHKMKVRGAMMLFTTLQILAIELIGFQGRSNETRATIRFILYPVFILWTLWYYRATYAQPYIPQSDINQLPPDQKCFTCNSWQPVRAEHCPACKKCIPKLYTHYHCIANCVGYHNEKFFYLYLVYTVILGLLYTESFLNEEDNLPILVKIPYWVFSIAVMLFTFVTFLLSFVFTMCIWSNVTMMERIKGMKFNWPCCPTDLSRSRAVQAERNPYDRLWMQNLCDVLGKWNWVK